MMKVNRIKYVDSKGVETEREIMPMSDIKNVLAIDVTTLTEDQLVSLNEQLEEYEEYRNMKMKQILSFENWADASGKDVDEVKWRKFNGENITLLD